jgi:ATP-dependent helicase/nuclease subunit A
MSNRVKPLIRLQGEQLRASDPRDLVWLSASAGTGKTHVLTARVLRMLLSGVQPETILCLTFTKAGAAEMADRIHARLAAWVRMDDAKLRKELFALGERNEDDVIAFARTLFAKVLDAPGGGLRIQTIHAFSQTLLAGFPAEAGLSPGFRPLEGREQAALARRTLADLLVTAEVGGDLGLIDDMQALSLRLGEDKAEAYLQRCARDIEAMEALGSRGGIGARVRLALDVPLGDVEQTIVARCCDDAFDIQSLRAIAQANADWGKDSGLKRAEIVARWLAGSPADRAMALADLHQVWAKADGEPRSFGKGQAPQSEGYADLAMRLHGCCAELIALRMRAALADLIAAGLRAGQAYALAYATAKRSAGLVDFDDLIRMAVNLLDSEGMGDWVRYKLDQATDHILVDEAQDTNARQWSIVAALAGEFFAGEGAKGSKHRTIFTVGDFKQAIFSFQGTDPAAFDAARRSFSSRAADAGREIIRLSLDRSFRSAPPVLELVDRLIDELGPDAMGLRERVPEHVSARTNLPGHVTLWKPLSLLADDGADDQGEEGWIDDATRAFATRLARQVRQWIDERMWVAGKERPLKPEDILILVRKRGDLASLIVARLHAEGVPVAGVDRLRLNAPLAVRDLLAAMRFAAQPEDDLTLASLLVSPLLGWSQERLYAVGFRRPGSLWRAVRDHADEAATAAALGDLLNRADFTTPHGFLEHILSGPLQGRRTLLARLGEEARDPIEELVNAAIGFSREATPSLQRFLDWFDRGEVEITRDPSAPLGAVRVMTVHGSKGLQSPLVILADATADPAASRAGTLDWPMEEDGGRVPVFRPRKAELGGSLAAALAVTEARETEEHWRLLYVALTRAEERLVIGGALGPRARGVPPEGSWYQAIDQAMAGLGAEIEDDPVWGAARHYRGALAPPAPRVVHKVRTPLPPMQEPEWLRRPAATEARPPRPLAPSAIGVDLVADPPPNPAMLEAARRGRLLHSLFERLPAVAPDKRQAAGERWLTGSAGMIDAKAASALVKQACAIIDAPDHAEIFSPDALAEAPIAAVVGEEVVAGTVDRLLVQDDRVRVVDFKTGRRVPGSLDAIPEHHLVQMAAYVAALETVFPDRPVEAALLYTSGPRLFSLPAGLIERHKQNFARQQEKDGGRR